LTDKYGDVKIGPGTARIARGLQQRLNSVFKESPVGNAAEVASIAAVVAAVELHSVLGDTVADELH